MKMNKAVLILFIILSGVLNTNGQNKKTIGQLYESGKISADEMILNKIYNYFDPSKVNDKYYNNLPANHKCGTAEVLEYKKMKESLKPETINIVENYLQPLATGHSYNSMHFKISYVISGTDAVPLGDLNNNSTPDYVEWIAEYLEQAWLVLVTQCGFRGPVDSTGDRYYNVSLMALPEGRYGYTSGNADGSEGTSIVIDNDFIGYPSNQDPEGNQKGSAKVTCAHEFMHAIIYLYSGLTGGDWTETHATWAEEMVFDYVNDAMLNFTNDSGPFKYPNETLDGSGEDYAKYFWLDYLHQKYDNNNYTNASIIKDFWERRSVNQQENIFDTYDYILQQRGSSLADAFTEFTVWNFYTGTRAISGFGYDEAGVSGFPMVELAYNYNNYPVNNTSVSGENLSACYIKLNPGGQSGIQVNVNGQNYVNMNAVITWTDGTNISWQKIVLSDFTNEGTIFKFTKAYGALIPVFTERSPSEYTCNYDIHIANTPITFTNKIGNNNAGGSFSLKDNPDNILLSGGSVNLPLNLNIDVSTNNERFTSVGVTNNYKHHDWDNVASENKLIHNFSISNGNNQNAYFIQMNPVTIKNVFDNTTGEGGTITFHDPWYVAENGSQPDVFIEYNSPHTPTGKYNANEGGVFINQTTGSGSYYVIRASLTQNINFGGTIGFHSCNFINWSSTGATLSQTGANPSGFDEKAVVFTSANAIVQANYKGIHLSGNPSAYAHSSQKKMVRSDDGKLHTVYTSMGRVWYEISSDNGSTWQIANGGQPLDALEGRNPSIDFAPSGNTNTNNIVIAFEENNNGNAGIKTQFFQNGILKFQNSFIPNPNTPDPYSSYDLAPVISYGYAGRVVLVWRQYGLLYRLGQVVITDNQFLWYNTATAIPNTDANSRVSSITCRNTFSTFHLAWEQSYSSIRYSKLTLINNSTAIQISDYADISSGCGFPTVYLPSIAVNSTDYPSVVWIGTPYSESSTKRVVMRSKSSSGWSSVFNQYDDMANNPVITATDDGSYLIPAWSYNAGSNTKCLRYGSIKSFNVPGLYVQLANASNLNSMYATAYQVQAVPYSFTNTPSVGSIAKESMADFSTGRLVIFTKDSMQFYMALGDIKLNGEAIIFIQTGDSLLLSGQMDVNNYLLSEPFSAGELSDLSFSSELGISDSLNVQNKFAENDNLVFDIVLTDENGNLISELAHERINKSTYTSNKNNTYNINLASLKGMTLRLGIRTGTNLAGNYTIANILNDGNVLEKRNAQQVSLKNSNIIKNYSLEQNYPNPFNPVTTINYQLPKEGIVTLKIYDAIGTEVTTLVHEYKQAGRYNVNFNASGLASGVYFYRLQVNDFTSSKKLILMK
jgi:hypothetical protein